MESYTQQMNYFGKTNPEELLAKYGSPLYVYNEDILRRQMRRVAGILVNHRFTSNFSIKTNSNLSILRMANEEGLNADAMSPGEIYVLKKAGFPSERIFYVPNNVSEEEMKGYIASHMAQHKVPRYVDFLDSFPMNAAGKILKYKMREDAVERIKAREAAK